MTNTTSVLRLVAVAALLTGTLVVTGCSSDHVTKTTTTEQSTTTTPAPVVSSTTTTTSHESRP
jgi:uncharacterized lipoprotein YajG